MTCSVRVSESEEKLFRNYAKFHRITVSQALRQALLERIEDEMDAKIADEAYEQFIKSGRQAIPYEKLWKEIGM